jgi:hypothetical protein
MWPGTGKIGRWSFPYLIPERRYLYRCSEHDHRQHSQRGLAYYTTDNSNPTSNDAGAPYTGAFTVSQSGTVHTAIHDLVAGIATSNLTINSSSTPAASKTAAEVATTAPLPGGQSPISFTVGQDSYTAGGQSNDMDTSSFSNNA